MRPSGGVCGEPGRAAEGSFQRPAVEHAAQSLSRPGGAAAFQTFPRRRHRPGPTEPAGVCFAVCAGVPEQPGVGSRAALRAEGSRAGGARRDAALGRGSVHLRHAGLAAGCRASLPATICEEEGSAADAESRRPLPSGVFSQKLEVFGASERRGNYHRCTLQSLILYRGSVKSKRACEVLTSILGASLQGKRPLGRHFPPDSSCLGQSNTQTLFVLSASAAQEPQRPVLFHTSHKLRNKLLWKSLQSSHDN